MEWILKVVTATIIVIATIIGGFLFLAWLAGKQQGYY
jgi:hypothetical protein